MKNLHCIDYILPLQLLTSFGMLFTDFIQVGIGLLIGTVTFVLFRIRDNNKNQGEVVRNYECIGFYEKQISVMESVFKDFVWAQRERFKHIDIIRYGKSLRKPEYNEYYGLGFELIMTIWNLDLRCVSEKDQNLKKFPEFECKSSLLNKYIQEFNDPLISKLWEIGTPRAIFDLLAHLELRHARSNYLLWNTHDHFRLKGVDLSDEALKDPEQVNPTLAFKSQ